MSEENRLFWENLFAKETLFENQRRAAEGLAMAIDQYIERFIKSIPEAASSWELFSHTERQRYGLEARRKR